MNDQEIKISIICKEFNKLSDLFRKTCVSTHAVFTMTDPAYRLMKGEIGKVMICEMLKDLAETGRTLTEISKLLQNVKDNYLKETEETTNKSINENENLIKGKIEDD